jgi:hypothetical protein
MNWHIDILTVMVIKRGRKKSEEIRIEESSNQAVKHAGFRIYCLVLREGRRRTTSCPFLA